VPRCISTVETGWSERRRLTGQAATLTGESALDGSPSGYDDNVFVNCPFDGDYLPLLRPLLFTVVYTGLNPRIASERLDSGENRVDKICELIQQSRYGIHDISRLRAARAKEYYRLNMPFELGIDYGARRLGPSFMRSKCCLVLEEEPYAYQKALSDLSGVDIRSHGNQPAEVVRSVRDWFYDTCGMNDLDYPTVIWNRSTDFAADLLETRLAEGIPEDEVVEDIERMTVSEYLNSIRAWVSGNLG